MENTDGKRKTAPSSIPANYISILQLQERWINEKNRKQKEEKEEERRRKQQMMEEDLKKAEVAGKHEERNKFEEKCLDRSNLKHWGGNSMKKEYIDGGEAISAEKDKPEVTAAIGSERGEDSAPLDEELQEKKRGRRKRYDSKKKKKTNKDVVEFGSIAPPEIIKTENKTPVNNGIQVYSKKGEKATGKKSIGSGEKDFTAIETKLENLSIKEEQIRSSYHNRLNRRKPRRVRLPIGTATMVWVKKGQNERAGDDGIRSVH